MSTPDYYKYDDGETHFECFDISRYYSGDWAQVIQYVFRWQKKGGIKDLEKALACAKDARDNGIALNLVTDDSILRRAITRKIDILEEKNYNFGWGLWNMLLHPRACTVDNLIEFIQEMIDAAKDAESRIKDAK